ncbi:Ribonuclease 3 (Ribonuclease III) (RNase III) [Acetoanaerobium sticklandii]|uniref:Ribonuclease 3 n=1 Tax=Acetoanaerobium sticklandii (strain ATCC 12662 / DSM 519 / JCM 1433 / CCUG 9281 / NCIMB 10654 / HF) TaxID=499177 RepID=E3PS51_ACESD|nr:ribonuclease III [Acetoanaerobium sticklandii]CBH21705.1 Ribonuclease 3 (Ribonuclease III) (RNase III) [Acetoanaerobium sticklandii]
MKSKSYELQKKINYEFQDLKLLKEALTHSSYSNEYKKIKNRNNERLEFLGDSILGLIISNYLFRLKKELPEGELTKIRAAIVCERSLKDIAKSIHLGEYLYLGKGEESTGGRTRDSILADATEALIAAIYLDGGFRKATDFVLEHMGDIISQAIQGKIMRDYKTQLQELIQKDNKENIIYKLVDQLGPDHDKTFKMNVFLGEKLIGTGIGKSKKEAEQEAAKDAMEKEN